ncbi:nucleotidyltransferase [Proteiniborus sp. DW1]|uniref:nucleotidyltransferase family protein n=1 Tax=Proteiniborus sp. DW1 TaxID=1889883 RepID=UPI00092E0B84|nr:nucleotidyltransferase domain-containing protein [Proteiniborus sp. DW1]SCG84176.1 nucleotidyltransferase [Proteiniborus sp. DW1]
MDNREISERINRFVESVIPEYNPEKIVLYGSYAKGTNNENSDIDIAIIVDEVKGSFLEKEARLYKIRRNIDSNIEPILIEKNSDRSGFLNHILSYGQILFSR